jgi:NAD(P)-dependent dehydrogenase (short-subunit alcohol dehydrogenase family)
VSCPVVVVTGASGGVGRGIAMACAQAGWIVWAAARRKEEGEAVVREIDKAGGQGRFIFCDAGEEVSVNKMIDGIIARDGRLNGLVHNATSGLSPQPVILSEIPMVDLHNHVAVSLRGSYLLAKAAYPHLSATMGSLVLLTSEAGFEGKARLPAYAAVKAGQRGLARSLAREWGKDRVRVNCLAPLASTSAMVRAFELDSEMEERVMGRNPLGYLGDSIEDIGTAVRFLLSNDSKYITGHTLMVDGGSCSVT